MKLDDVVWLVLKVVMGGLVAQALVGALALVGLLRVGKRIVTVEVPYVLRDIEKEMANLRREIGNLDRDMRQLSEEMGKRAVAEARLSTAVEALAHRLERLEGRGPTTRRSG